MCVCVSVILTYKDKEQYLGLLELVFTQKVDILQH